MTLTEIKKEFKKTFDLVIAFHIVEIERYNEMKPKYWHLKLICKLGSKIHLKRLNKYIKLKYHGM